LAAGGARGGERDDLGGREAALAQLGEHHGADGAGGADDSDAVGAAHARAPNGFSASTWSAPSSKAVCRARTARSTASPETTHEILIGEVAIISMLIASF